MKITKSQAIKFINQHHMLLVFPLKNQKDPLSLWHCFFPKTPLRWEWSDDGDDRVFQMWHLMKDLSDCGEVIYSKWYQNRGTFFSKKFFSMMLCYLNHKYKLESNLIHEAHEILELLRQDSPLSTKEIKLACNLQGKLHEGLYNKALKQLYLRGLIVSYGEKEDGAFPSSKMAATELIFENLYKEAIDLDDKIALQFMNNEIKTNTALHKFFNRNLKSLILK